MAQFIVVIAGILGLSAIAAGLALLFRASKGAPPPLPKVAGWWLVAGGIVVGLCTSYYWVTGPPRSGFDSMHPGEPGMMYGHANGTGSGTSAMPRGMALPTRPPGGAG